MTDPVFSVAPLEAGNGLRLQGELDMAAMPQLEAALAALPQGASIRLDLADLTFIDSTGLHALVTFARSLNGAGPLVLVNVQDSVGLLFSLVGVDQDAAIKIEADGR